MACWINLPFYHCYPPPPIGTWEQIEDKFLLAAGSSYSAGSTGGEAKHTLTNAELPKTSGGAYVRNVSFAKDATVYDNISSTTGIVKKEDVTNETWNTAHLNGGEGKGTYLSFSFGSSTAHNNMPPYLAVYMWKRTA